MKRTLLFTFISLLCLPQLGLSALGPIFISTDSQSRAPMPSQVEVITSEQIQQRGYADLSEALEQIPSVNSRQMGGLGSYSQVSIRGSSGHQISVYLDGVLLNDANGGAVDLSKIPLKNIQRIDLYKNTAPVSFTQQLPGGVIHLISKPFSKSTQITSSIGSFNARQLNVSTSSRKKKWATRLTMQAQTADNDFSIVNDNQTELNPFDDRVENRTNNQTTLQHLEANIRYLIDGDSHLATQLITKEVTQHLPDPLNNQQNHAFFTTKNDSISLNYAQYFNQIAIKTSLSISQKQESYIDLNNRVGLDGQDNDYETHRYSLQQDISIPLTVNTHASTLNVSLSLQKQSYLSIIRLGSLNYQASTKDYAQDQANIGLELPLKFLNQHLTITPKITRSQLTDKDKTARIKDSNDYSTLQLTLDYSLTDTMSFNSYIGNYFRTPCFSEKYADHGLTVGNEDLNNETGRTVSVGLVWTPVASLLPSLSLTSQLYSKSAHDLIVNSFDARGIGRYENVSSATIQGLELNLNFNSDWVSKFDLSYSYSQSKNQSDTSSFNGKKLPNTPIHQVDLFMKKHIYKSWSLFYTFHTEQGAFYDRSNLLSAEFQKIHNMGIQLQKDAWRAEFLIKNISDQSLEEFNGYPGPGRHYQFTFTTQL